MSMDGLSLYSAMNELNKRLAGGKIDKIQQTDKEELLLMVRSLGQTYRLLINASAADNRVQLTELKKQAPSEAPMFCMLLRKRIAGGKIVRFEQERLDRVLKISIETYNDLGDLSVFALYCELMGKHSNIILVNEKGVIADAIKHVGLGMSSVRFVMPGLEYSAPPAQDKQDPSKASVDDFSMAMCMVGMSIAKALSNAFFGLSPAVAAQLVARYTDKTECTQLSEAEREELAERLTAFYADMAQGKEKASAVLNALGETETVYPFAISGSGIKLYDSIGEALDSLYINSDRREWAKRHGASARKVLQNNIERCEKKLALYADALNSEEQMEKCRLYGELLEFEGGVYGMALDLEEDGVGAVLMDNSDSVSVGSTVKGTGVVAEVPVGQSLIGRVIDPIGRPLDSKPLEAKKHMPCENSAPTIMQRRPVDKPLETGIMAIDSMIPIGRGQRELIIGDRQTGKTSIAIDTVINQKNSDVLCIYCAIGQKASNISQIMETLKKTGAMKYSVVVAATASDSPAMQYLAPYAACAVAEGFMKTGKDVLVIYDDLSKHAVAYRALSLLIRRPPGREAYPGDVFYLHSRLLERAAKLSNELGGGSLTALPIIETQAGDVSAYIPTNVISITDGQIFLETELFHSGVMPAVNPGISVSRVGGNAQIKAMKKVAGTLKLIYSQYRELQSFAQFGSDLDADTKARLAQGERIVEVLKQNRSAPVPVEKQVAILYATIHDLLVKVKVADVAEYEKGLYEYLENDAAGAAVMETIRTTGNLDKDTEEALKGVLSAYTESFVKAH